MAATVSQVRSGNGAVTVELRGELDMRAESGLKSLLVDLANHDRPPHIVVDIRLVTFIDSTGIGALVAGYHAAKAHGITFAVREIAPFIETQLRVTGVYDMLTRHAPSG